MGKIQLNEPRSQSSALYKLLLSAIIIPVIFRVN